MLIGIIVGLVGGALVGFFFGYGAGTWPISFQSAMQGFGIGTAFIVIGWLINMAVKFLDRQSQKVR